MCGGAILSDIIPPPRRVSAGHLWPEKKKKQRKAGEGRKRRPRRGDDEELFKEESDEDFEADFEEFEVESGESELESDDDVKPVAATRSGVARVPNLDTEEKPIIKPIINNMTNSNAFSYPHELVVQPQNMSFVPTTNPAAPIQEPFMNLSSDQGSNSFSCSDFSRENDTRTPDITSVLAPIPTLTQLDESAFLQTTSNAVAPPVMENASVDLPDLEPYMNFLMDSGSDESMNTLLSCDGSQDVLSNMDLWTFEDMPFSAGINILEMKKCWCQVPLGAW
ncbi:hypothetical protein EJB05_45864 [Eragrostis curvula]|uniref:Uncharacterized protein n=1 Tax=Eragrostis curvula TaxID=38414 RepID=A0A5J9TNL6_9POAL|nr:hypothetical protein EJB05_45864 [Eragrostis curvula]